VIYLKTGWEVLQSVVGMFVSVVGKTVNGELMFWYFFIQTQYTPYQKVYLPALLCENTL